MRNYNILGESVVKVFIIQQGNYIHIKIAKVIGKT